MNVGSAWITIKPDTSKFRGDLVRQLRPIITAAERQIRPVRIGAVVNATAARRTLTQLASQVQRIDGSRVRVTAVANAAAASSQLRAVVRQMQRIDGQTVTAKVKGEADAREVVPQVRRIVAQAERQGPIRLDVRLNTRQAIIGLGALALAAKAASDEGTILSGVMGEVKGFALAASIAPASAALAGLSGAATGAVASLSPLVGLLPGIIVAAGSLGQAFGVVKLATMGLADALKEADPEKQAEAFAKLHPAAASFGRALMSLKPAMKTLQDAAAGGLFPGLERGLRAMTPLFATFRPIVSATALVIGDLANKLGILLGSPFFSGLFRQLGTANVGILQDLGRAALQLVTPLAQIAVAAIPIATRLGEMAESASRTFAAFIAGHSASGRLARFFEEAWAAARRLFGVLIPLARVIGGVGAAAKSTGDFILNGIGKALDELADKVNSGAGQAALRDYFVSFQPALTEMGRLVAAVGKAFVDFARKGVPALAPLIRQIREELLPAFIRVSDTAAPILPKLVTLFARMATAFSYIPLGPMLDGLNSLLDMFNRVADHPIGEWFLKLSLFITSPTNKLLFLASVVGKVALAFGLAKDEVGKSGTEIAGVVGYLNTNVLPAVAGFASFISEQFGNLAGFVREHWGQIQEAVSHVVNVIGSILQTFAAVAVGIWRALGDEVLGIVQVAWDQIRNVISTVVDIIAGVIQTGLAIINGDWGKAWDGIKRILAAAWEFIRETVVNGFRMAGQAVEAGISVIVALVKGIGPQILDAVGNLAGLLYNHGKAIMSGLLQGLIDGAPGVLGFAASLAGKIASLKGPLEKDRKLLIPAGEAIMAGLLDGLRNYEGDLVRQLSEITGRIAGVGSGVTVGGPSMGAGRGGAATVAPVFNVTIDARGNAQPQAVQRAASAGVRSTLPDLVRVLGANRG